jgi:CheY-like chemotaxis protein
MAQYVLAILLPLAVLAALTSVAFRLRLFSREEVAGRLPLLSGSVLLFLASAWQSAKSIAGYTEWFVPSAYPFLDLAQFLLFIIGLGLLVLGVSRYGDFWQIRQEEVESREQKLSLLNDLQREARQPYQLMELLDTAIKEIIAHLPECAGAIFLLNRSRRQFVLAASVGLTKDETASLEYYPLERNIVSQAVDLGDPLIAGGFDFVDRSGNPIKPRFKSCLVLPLVSEMEKIGGIILFAERTKLFGRAEIRFLSPVAEWLAEKIKSARLSKELSLAKNESEKQTGKYADFTGKLVSVTGAFSSPDVVNSFCESLLGLASCDTAHLFGLSDGSLHFYGGNAPLEQLSENYRTALTDALERAKPVIVNQEAVTDEGRSYIAFSSLVFPLGLNRSRDALLLRREAGAFKVDDVDLKNVEVFARLAAVVLEQNDARRLDITRRKGFQKILQLLRFDDTARRKEDWDFFVQCLADILPPGSATVVFVRETDGSFKARAGFPGDRNEQSGFIIMPGEGEIGQVAGGLEARFAFGQNKVSRLLESYSPSTRETFSKLFGAKHLPVFSALCPIAESNKVVAVAAIFLFDVAESERNEWERLITLVAGLYSTRLTVRALLLGQRREAFQPSELLSDTIGDTANRLNNHLSAVIGNAELASARTDLPEQLKTQLHHIITEAEQAAGCLRDSLAQMRPQKPRYVGPPIESGDVNAAINAILTESHISGNVYMLGAKAREVTTKLAAGDKVELADDVIRNLARETLAHFSSRTPDEEVVSVATYIQGDHLYLDISRHRKGFPTVEPVAGFGEYLSPSEVLRYRPADAFLQHIVNKNCSYAFDRFGQTPSYLSFKLPLRGEVPSFAVASAPKARILAIDDQPVILDLISAMCQSLGYEVQTASSAEEGLRLASQSSFDIVLTDLAMPGMSGLEVARKIRGIHPHTPIVLVTGWEVNVAPGEFEASGVTEVLYKPFRIEQLTDIIRSAVLSKSVP